MQRGRRVVTFCIILNSTVHYLLLYKPQKSSWVRKKNSGSSLDSSLGARFPRLPHTVLRPPTGPIKPCIVTLRSGLLSFQTLPQAENAETEVLNSKATDNMPTKSFHLGRQNPILSFLWPFKLKAQLKRSNKCQTSHKALAYSASYNEDDLIEYITTQIHYYSKWLLSSTLNKNISTLW